MMKNLMLFLALIFISAPAADAVSASSAEESARMCYKNGRYDRALEIYDSLLEADGMSAQLLFNMGNIYTRLDKLGAAMVLYEKARALDPSNSLIRNNVLFLRDKIQDRNKAKLHGKNVSVEPDRLPFMKSMANHLSERTSPSLWGIAAVVAFILMLAGVALYLFSPAVMLRKIGFFGGIFFMILTVMLNIFAFTCKSYWAERDMCIITAFEATMLPEPDPKAKPQVAPLVSGTELMIISSEDTPAGWVKAKLNSAYVGYLPASAVQVL